MDPSGECDNDIGWNQMSDEARNSLLFSASGRASRNTERDPAEVIRVTGCGIQLRELPDAISGA